MFSRHSKSNLSPILSSFKKGIRGMGKVVIRNEVCRIIRITVSESDNFSSGKIFQKILGMRNILIENQDSVLRQLFNKLSERLPNFIDILEEIQVVCLNIQNNLYRRKERKERIGIFTGFRQKYVGFSHSQVSSDILHHSPHRNSRIHLGFQQNLANHRGRRRLSVCPGNIDGFLVVFHDSSQKLCTTHCGNTLPFYLLEFGITFCNCGSINAQLYSAFYIFRTLRHGNLNSQGL